jgi:hypothetical protein
VQGSGAFWHHSGFRTVMDLANDALVDEEGDEQEEE